MTKQEQAIATAESFAQDWHRGDWMQEHGEWASAEWDDEREAYDAAHKALTKLLAEHASAERIDRYDAAALRAEADALAEAAEALDGQVRPDESDYIAEGTIDPDEVAHKCGEDNKIDGGSHQGWDCIEGHAVHLLDDGRVIYNWYRSPYGNTNRHARDLYVVAGEVEQGEPASEPYEHDDD